jgi:DNA invertase Pin-like site-specific DNA recombinase
MMKKAAIYARVSTPDQHVENQILDLRKLASQRGFEVVREYCDHGISGSKARRPGLDAMIADGRRGAFSLVLVVALDRLARSTRNLLEIVDELNSLQIELVSAREAVETGSPMGRMVITVCALLGECEKAWLVERIKAGMRRARMEGQRLGRAPLNVDRAGIVRDRLSGMSLTQVAKRYRVSRATVVRLVKEAGQREITVAA